MNQAATDDPQTTRRGFTLFDGFMSFNATLLIGSTLYAYAVTDPEFGLYAVVIFLLGALAWRTLRRYEYPGWMLLLLQVAVFAHFAGGFLMVGEDPHSLYWHYVFGIRYDRIVHVFNSAIVAVAIMHIFRSARLKLTPMQPFVIIMVVGGLGAGIEILEFVAVSTIPNTGVGDHANTIEDMVANFLGAGIGVALVYAADAYAARSREAGDPGVQ